MPSPEPIAPERLEELLAGSPPDVEQEARVQGLVRELRAGSPSAPEPLRARVSALGEQPKRRRRALPVRRAALALALLAVVGALGAAIAFGDGGGNDDDSGGVAAPAEVDVGAAELSPATPEEESGGGEAFGPAREEAPAPTAGERAAAGDGGAEALVAPPGRATDIDLWLEVRVAGADQLSAAAGEAMAVTRELGGWVAASDLDTEGNEGAAELALRVPVGRVEDAVVQLSGLGTVTGERVETVDLQAGIDRRASRIELLARTIRMLELRLESETLTPQQELAARVRLERLRNDVDDLRRENRAARREAATSELALVLHTREAPAAAEEDEGGAAGAAGDALRFLAAAGTIALFLAIVLTPAILLLVLLWLAFRARSRRSEARLLDRPDPASPPSA
jgi:hypothetical protein